MVIFVLKFCQKKMDLSFLNIICFQILYIFIQKVLLFITFIITANGKPISTMSTTNVHCQELENLLKQKLKP